MISHPPHFFRKSDVFFNDINSAVNAYDLFSKMSVFRLVFMSHMGVLLLLLES